VAHGCAAQQTEPVRRIGVLVGLSENDPEMKEDYRFAPAGTQAHLLARELVALQPDVILAQSTPATAALKPETSTIPIVFAGVADPIGSGFIASLSRPGGNLTGLLQYEEGITGKWLGMLKEILPTLTRAALLANPSTAAFD
jgi:putative tryptophan/tyrosine transport system substrate-binding protein